MNNIETFDWMTYVLHNEDLQKAGINTKEKAWNHWIVSGSKEGRISYDLVGGRNSDNIFNWRSYVSRYEDLQRAEIETEEKAFEHFIVYGRFEGRIYNSTPKNNKLNIIYQVGNTAEQGCNTGIQRVVRLLGKYFHQKCNLYLVKFDRTALRFVDITCKERKWLENFNGIPFPFKLLDLSQENKWFVNAEISYDIPSTKLMFDEARRNNMKIATLYYDDIQFKMNHLWPSCTRESYNIFIRNLCEADLIFPISQYSQSRLQSHVAITNIDTNKKIFPCILPGEFPNVERNYHYNIPKSNKYHILCVGVINSRKNQISLLQAISKLKNKSNIVFTLVGPIDSGDKRYNDVLRLMKLNKVIHHNQVSDDHLKNLYLNSHLTVFPSIEEGFGLPILESIWNCRPCICMNNGAMGEIATGGCLKVDCNDPKQISDAIERILYNNDFREKLIDEIKLVKFKTWNQYTDEVIENILRSI